MDEVSIFLAKFWGWYFIIFFLILSLNPKRILQIIKDLEDQKFVIVISFMAIVIGLLNVLFHNIWEDDWRLIITFIGWITLFKGLSLFVFPKRTVLWLDYFNIKFVQVIYMMLFFVGLFLLNMGYGIIIFQ